MSPNPHNILPELQLNWELAGEMLVRFIRSEVRRAGFSQVVLGLSGGIDSSLAAFFAVKALGEGKVLGMRMPYRTSSPESSLLAEKITRHLGITLETVEITPMADGFFALKPDMEQIRQGNVMARLRMLILYDKAAESRALVLGTGNKTEILLGYTTLFGDSACSLNPIGDLYKTQVWAMSAFFNLPEEIIARTPSADLWSGQTDEGELGVQYETADAILFHLVDKRLKPEEVIALGFSPETVQKIAELMRRNQFKRMMPPIPKLSPRTVGGDFLFARDWGT